MAMEPPAEEKREVPAYMVSFGDMITLLLTFFILLVALADTQLAGLVGAGRGPLIKHVNAEGRPGVMKGRLTERRLEYKADSWWIPSQEGDPDELERVEQKLLQELQLHFKPDEAHISYEDDRLVLRLPARVNYDRGRPVLDPGVQATMALIADQLQRNSERRVRINGDVARGSLFQMSLLESATQGRLIYQQLLRAGVRPHQMSIWGWGSTRPLLTAAPSDPRNQGLTLEIMDAPAMLGGQTGDEDTSDGR